MPKLTLMLSPVVALLLLSFGLLGLGPLTCQPPASFELGLPIYGQGQSNWCWAASGALIMNTVHAPSNVTQCDEAKKQFGASVGDCCANPSTCNKRGLPQFGVYGFDVKQTSTMSKNYLTWTTIKSQLYCKRKPFAFIWSKPDGGKHMMVATGYSTNNTGQVFVFINDPLPVHSGSTYLVPYQDYNPHPFSDHSLYDNYYDVTYKGHE